MHLETAVTLYDFTARLNSGKERDLSDLKGKVVLVVNVASKCGFTPQYKGLEELHRRFAPRGFEILAFPWDQFGHQEPGSDGEIAAFCDRNHLSAVRQGRGQRRWRPSALRLAQAAEARAVRPPHQMEFHEISGRQERQCAGAVRADDGAGTHRASRARAAVRTRSRAIGRFAGSYSLAQAASIPKALSEIIVATISTIIDVQSPESVSPGRDRAIVNVAEVRRPSWPEGAASRIEGAFGSAYTAQHPNFAGERTLRPAR
jgi:hypothetical protein